MRKEDLQNWRESRGLSRKKLADALGTTEATVWRWENGKRDIPAYLFLALDSLGRKIKTVVAA